MIRAARLALLLTLAAVVVAGCYGNPVPPAPGEAPEDCEPVKILFVGDSLMEAVEPAIVDRFHELGYDPIVQNIAHGGSNALEYGLALVVGEPPPFANPRAELQEYLDTFQPDIVVVNWGINRSWTMDYEGVPGFLQSWVMQNVMNAVRDMVDQSDAELYWTTIPPRDDNLDNRFWVDAVNEQVVALGVPLIDWRAAVTDEYGLYEDFIKYREDDTIHAMRTQDRVHLYDDGIQRVVQWTVSALAPVACRP